MRPLIINDEVREQLKALVALAEANPVQMEGLLERLEHPDEKAKHMAQMTRQSVEVPIGFLVTLSIENGHPLGRPCRHMSMSVDSGPNRVPNPQALWMVAQELGFWGTVEDCDGVWSEQLQGHGQAINVVQRIKQNEAK